MFVLSPTLRDIFHTSMARYSLFVLKMPLNSKQANKPPSHGRLWCTVCIQKAVR